MAASPAGCAPGRQAIDHGVDRDRVDDRADDAARDLDVVDGGQDRQALLDEVVGLIVEAHGRDVIRRRPARQ